MGYYSDMGHVMEEASFNGYDADDEVLASGTVHKGDKVMIQSKISGKLIITVTVLKGLRHGWRILKNLAIFFKFAVRNPS